jgi:hypothetical protein
MSLLLPVDNVADVIPPRVLAEGCVAVARKVGDQKGKTAARYRVFSSREDAEVYIKEAGDEPHLAIWEKKAKGGQAQGRLVLQHLAFHRVVP